MRIRRVIPGALLAPLVGLVLGAGVAHAGEWIQVSCVNPSGTAAPSQGWSAQATATGYGSGANTTCAPGTPMAAILSSDVPEPVYSYVQLVYTPPTGSTVVGGSLDAFLSGEGGGTNATGFASIDEPDTQFPTHNLIYCSQGLGGCGTNAGTLSGGTVSGADFTGEYTLPADLGGDVYVAASCGGSSGYSCDSGGQDGAWALAQVDSADIALQSNAVPIASGFSGTVLGRRVTGTGNLILDASDPGGPGVYEITATINGTTVYQATPNPNSGECVPVGSDGSALEFDYQQPCPTTVAAEIPIPTAALPDGTYQLQVSVTDAAGNTSPVFDRTITTFNPQPTPRPLRGLTTQFVFAAQWAGAHTRFADWSVHRLPRDAHVSVSCSGRHCPRLTDRSASARGVARLLRGLDGRRFAAGDRLLITVSAPRRRALRIEIVVRNGARPSARLLSAAPRRR